MNYVAIYFAFFVTVLPAVGFAVTNTNDIYSESVTRQLSSAEVPKSFDSNARHASTESDVDSAMDSRIVETAILSADEDEAPAIVESASKKALKKPIKKASR